MALLQNSAVFSAPRWLRCVGCFLGMVPFPVCCFVALRGATMSTISILIITGSIFRFSFFALVFGRPARSIIELGMDLRRGMLSTKSSDESIAIAEKERGPDGSVAYASKFR